MRSFVIVSAALCAFAVAACGGAPSSEADSSAESAASAPTFDAFGKSLVGKYTDSGFSDGVTEFVTLELHLDGSYTGTRKSAKSGAKPTTETGRFTANTTAQTLSLAPTAPRGAKRTYGVQVDTSTLMITPAGATTGQALMYTSRSECLVDSDCGDNAVCNISNTARVCGVKTLPTTPDAGAPTHVKCSKRRGGALITFKIAGSANPDGKHDSKAETFAVWSTNTEFIDRAKLGKTIPAGGTEPQWGTPNFDQVVAGKDDCNPGYAWHVEPQGMAWGDLSMEICDAAPSYIQSDIAGWISTPTRYCPWGPQIVRVDDRR